MDNPNLKLAKLIEVDNRNFTIKIDGVEFPYYIGVEGVTLPSINRTHTPQITITIPADEVQVVHSIYEQVTYSAVPVTDSQV